MLIRKRECFQASQSASRVSILLILDVDSEAMSEALSWAWYLWFQSFLFWMLIRKLNVTKRCVLRCSSFNPSYSGCWFGSTKSVLEVRLMYLFQSFLFWMLIRKLEYEFSLTEKTLCFNPSYSGCWFGSGLKSTLKIILMEVSILLILDVDSEERRAEVFGAIRRNVSILLILDVDSEADKFQVEAFIYLLFQSFLFWMLIRKLFQGFCWLHIKESFNPSYSGCWFGSLNTSSALQKKHCVSILLILDVDSEAECRYRFRQ